MLPLPIHELPPLISVEEKDPLRPERGEEDVDTDDNGRKEWKKAQKGNGGATDGELVVVGDAEPGKLCCDLDDRPYRADAASEDGRQLLNPGHAFHRVVRSTCPKGCCAGGS